MWAALLVVFSQTNSNRPIDLRVRADFFLTLKFVFKKENGLHGIIDGTNITIMNFWVIIRRAMGIFGRLWPEQLISPFFQVDSSSDNMLELRIRSLPVVNEFCLLLKQIELSVQVKCCRAENKWRLLIIKEDHFQRREKLTT